MSVADYNTDPDSNTSISGINIAEGCPPSGINNAIRQMMADIKTADDADVKLTGSQTIAGIKTFSDVIVRASTSTVASIKSGSETSATRLWGGDTSSSARLALFGNSAATYPGQFILSAADGVNDMSFWGRPDGTLTWGGKDIAIEEDVVMLTGDQTVGGVKTFTSSILADSTSTKASLKSGADSSAVRIWGGDGNRSSRLVLNGKDSGTKGFLLVADNGTTGVNLQGLATGSLTWNGQPIQTTSDERLKTPLVDIPDAVLDAWGAVGWGQFQYLDAVEAKGADKARLHLGLIAQHVKAVFEARGLDACKYGILCHDEHPATDDGPAVDLWTVRYTEAFAMEVVYQRRRADRAEARIADLERRLAALEAAFVATGA